MIILGAFVKCCGLPLMLLFLSVTIIWLYSYVVNLGPSLDVALCLVSASLVASVPVLAWLAAAYLLASLFSHGICGQAGNQGGKITFRLCDSLDHNMSSEEVVFLFLSDGLV